MIQKSSGRTQVTICSVIHRPAVLAALQSNCKSHHSEERDWFLVPSIEAADPYSPVGEQKLLPNGSTIPLLRALIPRNAVRKRKANTRAHGACPFPDQKFPARHLSPQFYLQIYLSADTNELCQLLSFTCNGPMVL